MKRILSPFAILLAAAPITFAHVGSPNVYFEGRAGTYPIYAVIRPPAALPGPAQVSVRATATDLRSVSLLPVMWQAGRGGSPRPVAANRVPGETNLWSGEIWLLRPGSYTVQVRIDGAQGLGEAIVPLNAIARENQRMEPGLRATLLVFGLLLFFSAVFIVEAVARQGCLVPDINLTSLNATHARRTASIALVLLVAGVAMGAVRWRNMDLAYREGIQRPEPVAAVVRSEVDRAILELRQDEQSVSLPSWAALLPDHGKLMHLFLIRETDLDVFAHVHPIRSNAHTFALELPALPAGGYQLYGDVTFENGISQTLIARVALPESIGGPALLPPLVTNLAGEVICGFPPSSVKNVGQVVRDMDDSWHIGQPGQSGRTNRATVIQTAGGLVSRLMGGNTLVFENMEQVVTGRETSLRFAAFAPDGSEANLQPYMGMLGHAAVRRVDGSVFAHLHPSGSFSMAAQDAFQQRERVIGAATATNPLLMAMAALQNEPTNRVSFPYQFPKPGSYRLWIQVRIAGRVLTGVYDLEIKTGA